MITIHTVTGKQVWEQYVKMFESDKNITEIDNNHFEQAFQMWIDLNRKCASRRIPFQQFSLNRKTYAGKKTLALLALLNLKFQTLGELILYFWNEIEETEKIF